MRLPHEDDVTANLNFNFELKFKMRWREVIQYIPGMYHGSYSTIRLCVEYCTVWHTLYRKVSFRVTFFENLKGEDRRRSMMLMTCRRCRRRPTRDPYGVAIVGGATMGACTAWFLASNPDFKGKKYLSWTQKQKPPTPA